jgi:hypothetical protein
MTTADRTIQGSSASSIGVSTYTSSQATLLPTTKRWRNLLDQRFRGGTGGSVLERDTGKVYMPAKKFNHSRIFADL